MPTWSVAPGRADDPAVVGLLRRYFAELTVRWFARPTTDDEVDETLARFPTSGLAVLLVLRDGGTPAGLLGVHATGELTRMYVVPERRRAGGGRLLLAAAEDWARGQGLDRLFLDTRTDLVEARAAYAAAGFRELPPPPGPHAPFQDHWFEKRLSPS